MSTFVIWNTKEELDLSVRSANESSLAANERLDTEYGELSHAKIEVVPKELKVVVMGNRSVTVQLEQAVELDKPVIVH